MEKLDKKNIEDMLALTPMQEGMLFHYLKDSESDAYFEQLSLNISGEIDVKTFEKAWNFVVETNEMLRAVFRWEKVENAIQIILKEHQLRPKYFDFPGTDPKELKMQLEEVKVKDRKEKFDLREVPFKVTLCKIEEDKYEMIISNHHILYDGWSNGIILKEFFKTYSNLVNGNKSIQKPVKSKYKNFVKWNQNQDIKKQEKYWPEYLKGVDTGTELSVKVRRKDSDEPKRPGNYRITFPRALTNESEDCVKEYKVTLAALFYSACGILIQRYNNCEDVMIGTTVSGRSPKIKGIEDMVGLFINTLPLRFQIHSNKTAIDLIYEINEVLKKRDEYDGTPLPNIKKYSALASQEELFDTLVALENYPLDSRFIRENPLLSSHSYSLFEMTNYDLTIRIVSSDEIEVNFIYNKACYDEITIKNLSHHFTSIVKEIINRPGKEIPGIDVFTEEEKKQVLFIFNETGIPYPRSKMIIELFEAQVDKKPGRRALVSPNQCLTYGELNKHANRVGQVLREKGIGPNCVVGLMVERSIQMMVGLLGILKAGGAYLPIDPNYPVKRVRFMMEDSESRLLLALPRDVDPVDFSGEVINIEKIVDQGKNKNLDGVNINSINSPEDLVYMIYTSGSTGNPKGVMVKIDGFMNLLHWYIEEFKMNGADNVLLIAPISFDLTQKNLFSPHFIGARLSLAPPGLPDYHEMSGYIAREQITIINCAPSVFYPLVECNSDSGFVKLQSLRYVFLGGEPIQAGKLLPWVNSGHFNCEIVNTYGPTECTDISSFYRIPRQDLKQQKMVPIGKPINNVKLFILDRNRNVFPVGFPGELCIGGVSLSRGYYNNSRLNREKFIETPHLPEKMVYCTGDMTRWLPDGNIEFLGRIDYQVKIRGLRIECGEIESQLLTHEAIKEAVVVAKESKSGSNYLCAYIVARSTEHGAWRNITELRESLAKELPDYMIPTYFVWLEQLPLTPSGKVDRKTLPEPEIAEIEDIRTYVAPRDKVEKKLSQIWREVLEIEKKMISIDSNFFELGGHSLKVIGLAGRINKRFNIQLPISEIFNMPTIREQAAYINKTGKTLYLSIEPVEEKEYYPLSSAQMRLFFLNRVEGIKTTYNLPVAMEIRGKLDKHRFEMVFHQLIQRHESLRTSFRLQDGKPVQVVHEAVDFHVNYIKASDEQIKDILSTFIQPFDLEQAPLFRVGLVEVTVERYFLLFDMHHIISDGVSTAVLVREFGSLYEGNTLPELPVQYRDYSQWQSNLLETHRFKQQKAYWLRRFEGELPALNLHTDYPRPAIQDFSGDDVEIQLEMDLTKKLKQIVSDTDFTLFMVLLAAFNILLSRYTEQEDIVVGIPIAGRNHPDVGNLVGMFVNTLAMKNQVKENQSFKELLQQIKENALDAFDNQDYPLEELVNQLNIPKELTQNPLFNILFVFENFGVPQLKVKGLTFTPYSFERKISHLDLVLYIDEDDSGIKMSMEYATVLFKRSSIERMLHHYIEVLNRVVENQEQKLKEITVSHGLTVPDSNILLENQVDFGF